MNKNLTPEEYNKLSEADKVTHLEAVVKTQDAIILDKDKEISHLKSAASTDKDQTIEDLNTTIVELNDKIEVQDAIKGSDLPVFKYNKKNYRCVAGKFKMSPEKGAPREVFTAEQLASDKKLQKEVIDVQKLGVVELVTEK